MLLLSRSGSQPQSSTTLDAAASSACPAHRQINWWRKESKPAAGRDTSINEHVSGGAWRLKPRAGMVFPQSSSSWRFYIDAHGYMQEAETKTQNACCRRNKWNNEKQQDRIRKGKGKVKYVGEGAAWAWPWVCQIAGSKDYSLTAKWAPQLLHYFSPPSPWISLTSASSIVMQTVNMLDVVATWWRHSHQSTQQWWVCHDLLGKLGRPNKEKFKWHVSHLQIYLLQVRSLDKKRPKIIYMMKPSIKG